MPFLHYELDNLGYYTRKRKIPLAGRQGPLARYMERECTAKPEWHLSEARILSELAIENVDSAAIVIDMKPNVKGNVSLYRLRDIWGYRGDGWAPLALRLEGLYVDAESANPEVFKQRFPHPRTSGGIVHEFLYLGKNWNWGMVGRVNGALLWRDAFDYFVTAINDSWPKES